MTSESELFVTLENSQTVDSVALDGLAEECVCRCRELAAKTEVEGEITRRFLSPAMRDVHHCVVEWMETLGMTCRVDAAGNLIGRREASVTKSSVSTKTLMVGSHLDTVPNAGAYDGVLGVMLGLAVVKALGNTPLPFHVDVIGFSEEEGVRFAKPYLGSQAIAGCFENEALERRDAENVTMLEAIARFGLDPSQISEAMYRPEEVVAFVEVHIEQGPVLGHEKCRVGLVEHIAGQSRLTFEFLGDAGHAGTTPMTLRRDALLVASRWVAAVNDYALAVDGLRATVGAMNVQPNVRNVIPSCVDVTADIRHESDATREKAVDDLCRIAEELAAGAGVEVRLKDHQSQPAAHMDSRLCELMKSSMMACDEGDLTLLSGAGHDAVVMSDVFPTALLFVRQENGVSHHPDEHVEVDDVAAAIKVTTEFVNQLRKEH